MLGHFHHAYMYFCTHVLPAVYDESLSYYEVLCKLCDSMKELWESQKEVIEITKAAENIVNTLWPEYQQEINQKLQEYEEAYTQYTETWNAALEKAESDIQAMQTELSERLQVQDKAIQDNNAAQLALINQKLTAQDSKIDNIEQSTLQKLAAQDQKIQDFIDTYNPVPVPTILYPQAVIKTGPSASVSAVGPDGSTITGTADTAGNLTLNLPQYGNWTITASSSLGEKQAVISVNDVKQYNISLVPTADLTITVIAENINPAFEAAFLRGKYRVTGPNGYSQVVNASTDPVSFKPTEYGQYKVEIMLANALPESTDTGYVITGSSEIYTTVYTFNDTLSSTSRNFELHYTPPTVTLTHAQEISTDTITVTPPTVTESATDIVTDGVQYTFMPWVIGTWKFTFEGEQYELYVDELAGNYALNIIPVRATINITSNANAVTTMSNMPTDVVRTVVSSTVTRFTNVPKGTYEIISTLGDHSGGVYVTVTESKTYNEDNTLEIPVSATVAITASAAATIEMVNMPSQVTRTVVSPTEANFTNVPAGSWVFKATNSDGNYGSEGITVTESTTYTKNITVPALIEATVVVTSNEGAVTTMTNQPEQVTTTTPAPNQKAFSHVPKGTWEFISILGDHSGGISVTVSESKVYQVDNTLEIPVSATVIINTNLSATTVMNNMPAGVERTVNSSTKTTFTNVPEGTWTFTATNSDGNTAAQSIAVTESTTYTQTITVPALISATVAITSNSGATTTMENMPSGVTRTVTSDTVTTFTNVPKGSWAFISVIGDHSGGVTVTVSESKTYTADNTLEIPNPLSFIAVDYTQAGGITIIPTLYDKFYVVYDYNNNSDAHVWAGLQPNTKYEVRINNAKYTEFTTGQVSTSTPYYWWYSNKPSTVLPTSTPPPPQQ